MSDKFEAARNRAVVEFRKECDTCGVTTFPDYAFSAGADFGFAFAMESAEVRGLVEACKTLDKAFTMAGPTDPVAFVHNMTEAVRIAKEALAAWNKARGS